MRRIVRLVALSALALAASGIRPLPAAANHPSPATSTAQQVAEAVLAEPTGLVSAGTNAGYGDGDPVAYLARSALGSFMPTSSSTFGIVSTGTADDASQPNNEENLSTEHGPGFSKIVGSEPYDLAQLIMTMTAPAGTNCMGFDFVFYSDEFPEFIGTEFNDTFTAELGSSNLSISGNDVVAPNNFVRDPNNDFITVNNAFGVSSANSAGTTYDGATPLLRTQTPINSTQPVVLILSVMDLGDSIYDSSTFIDNIRFTTTDNCVVTTALQGGQKPQPCLGPTWYFAEGTTREGFVEYLALFNVLTETVVVEVDYLFADGSTPVTIPYTLGPTSRTTIAVWEQPGVGVGKDVSLVVRSRRQADSSPAPIASERAMYFNFPTGRGTPAFPSFFDGSHTVRGEPAPFPEWFFAEGTTLGNFDQYLTIQNPGTAQQVDIVYSKSDSSQPIVKTFDLAANSRRTILVFDANDGVGRGVEGVSARVVAKTSGILVERPMYFAHTFSDPTGTILANGGHVDFGAVPDDVWYLSEGNVLLGWFMFLTIYNPYASPKATHIQYQLEGEAPIAKDLTATQFSRTTIKVFDPSDPYGIGRNVSDPVSRGVSVKVTTDDPAGVVVERPIYFDAPFPDIGFIDDGTDKAGSRFLKKTFYFSEGTTRTDFDYFFTFQNPTTETASVNVRYFLPDGSVVNRSAQLPPSSRTTVQIWAADQVGKGALGQRETDFAAEIKSNVEILVERPSYTNHRFPLTYVGPPGLTSGGSVVFGLPDPCI